MDENKKVTPDVDPVTDTPTPKKDSDPVFSKTQKVMLSIVVAFAMCCGIAGGYAEFVVKPQRAAERKAAWVAQDLIDEQEAQAEKDRKLAEYLVKEEKRQQILKEKEIDKGTAPLKKEDEEPPLKNEKPQPPEKPTIPEDQKNDPSKKPEPVLPPAPPKDNTPSNGDRMTDSSGQEWIYVGGFGWHKPTGGEVETAEDMIPNGNLIGH